MVKYDYTAYGEIVEVNDDTNYELSKINPFRYKGYYYDEESKMYYCKTRYYVPEWCRWLNTDSPLFLDFNNIQSTNLFSYCGNDPVNNVDPNGNSSDSVLKNILGFSVMIGLAIVTTLAVFSSFGTLLITTLVGAGVGAGLNLAGQGVSKLSQGKGFFEDINWLNVTLGAITGVAFATSTGGLWGAIGIGASSNAGMSEFEGNSWTNIIFSAFIGMASALVGFKLGKIVSNKLLNINTNLSLSDYANMARVDGAGFLSRSIVALMSKLYTTGPTIATGLGRGVTKFVGNYIGDKF